MKEAVTKVIDTLKPEDIPGGAGGEMDIVPGNWLGNTSSNPGRDW